ncbi:MAG: glycosyltransferase [Candidatus Edwardsbacteria bacterium]|nr:glycosyltransferase [Candidatus Edwardsbacteria bacterium]
MPKKILIICFTDIARDPRVRRQISFLKNSYEITVLGSGDPGIAGITYLHCPFKHHTARQKVVPFLLLAGRQYEKHYWRQSFIKTGLKLLENRRYDLLIANEINSLPLAVAAAGGAKILFDAHEYYPGSRENTLIWELTFKPYFLHLCRRFLPGTDAFTTVSHGIAGEYERIFKMPATVITNASDHAAITPRPTDPSRIRLVHHGLAIPTRKIEDNIEILKHLDGRFELNLVFSHNSDKKYIRHLKNMTRQLSNVVYHEPVEMENIPAFISRFDIGLAYFKPTTFNLKHVLPNKFFEFIQARLAIAVGPSPEMAGIVSRHGLGLVSPSFAPADLAGLLNTLSAAQIDEYKHNSDKAARLFCAENNKAVLLDLIGSLVGH